MCLETFGMRCFTQRSSSLVVRISFQLCPTTSTYDTFMYYHTEPTLHFLPSAAPPPPSFLPSLLYDTSHPFKGSGIHTYIHSTRNIERVPPPPPSPSLPPPPPIHPPPKEPLLPTTPPQRARALWFPLFALPEAVSGTQVHQG